MENESFFNIEKSVKKDKPKNLNFVAGLLCFVLLIFIILLALVQEEEEVKGCNPGCGILSGDHHIYDGGTNHTQPIAKSDGIIDIKWSYEGEYPRGNQDNAGTMYKNKLFSTGGFCGGCKAPYFCDGRDFYNDTYLYDTTLKEWEQVEDMPGINRQGHKCENINDQVYCWGGFSYTAPYSHSDGYKYNGSWSRLPDLPSNFTAALQMTSCNNIIYFLEGGYYNYSMFFTSNKFYKFDGQWIELADMPGTPRWSTDITCYDNKIYLLGGVSGQENKGSTLEASNDKLYKTIIDNWVYNIQSNTWTRLPDTPFVLGNWMFQIMYDKYILLIGGAGYHEIETNHTNVNIPSNLNHQHSPLNSNYFNDYLFTNAVYLFDTDTYQFNQSTPLPFDWNGATVWLKDKHLYLNAGEAGSVCWNDKLVSRHTSVVLRGTIL